MASRDTRLQKWWRRGVGILTPPHRTRLTDSIKREKAKKQIRRSEVHQGYTEKETACAIRVKWIVAGYKGQLNKLSPVLLVLRYNCVLLSHPWRVS
jgi:hypothetical protein